MLTEKGVMKTEAIFSYDKRHRYLLRKEWDTKKPRATIIMTNPSTANLYALDYTTLHILNNLIKLNFGSVDIVNMISKTTTKLNVKEDLSGEADEENVKHILKSAEKADKIIIAWGRLGENNKKVRLVQYKLLEQLQPHKDKLCIIASESGESGFHPLAPQIRFTWVLQKYEIPKPQSDTSQAVKPDEKETPNVENGTDG